MAAAPRFAPSPPVVVPGVVTHSTAAIGPAAPPATVAVAMPAIAAVGATMTADTKRTAAAVPAVPSTTDLVSRLQELEKQIATDWNTKYFSPFLAPLSFADVRHLTPSGILELCFFNIAITVLHSSPYSVSDLLKLIPFDHNPNKTQLLIVFDRVLTKVTLPADKKIVLKNHLGHCIDLFNQLNLDNYQPVADKPLVVGLPIPPESPVRIRKILDILEPKWVSFVENQKKVIAMQNQRVISFLQGFDDNLFKRKEADFLVKIDILQSNAIRIVEFVKTFLIGHQIGEIQVRKIYDSIKKGITKPSDHSTMVTLKYYFHALHLTCISFQKYSHHMEALWFGRQFPSNSPGDIFFKNCVKLYIKINSKLFNFIDDPRLTPFNPTLMPFVIINPDPVAVTRVTDLYFDHFKVIMVLVKVKMCSLFPEKTDLFDINTFIDEFYKFKFEETTINSLYDSFKKDFTTAIDSNSDQYLKNCLINFFKSFKFFVRDIINFVFHTSKKFPANNTAKLANIVYFLEIAEEEILKQLKNNIVSSGVLPNSVHHTLSALNKKMMKDDLSPLALEDYSNRIQTFSQKITLDLVTPKELRSEIPSFTLLADVEFSVLNFSFINAKYLSLCSHALLPSRSLEEQAKAADKVYADLMMELDDPGEEEEKAEADSKGLAETLDEGGTPAATPKTTHRSRKSRHRRGKATALATPPAMIIKTDPVVLINSLFNRISSCLGKHPSQQSFKMRTRIGRRLGDAHIALDRMQHLVNIILQQPPPTMMAALDRELDRAGYQFLDSFMGAAQLSSGTEADKITHNLRRSAKKLLGRSYPNNNWTTLLRKLGLSDRFAGIFRHEREEDLKVSKERILQKFHQLVELFWLVLRKHAPNKITHAEEIAKACETLKSIITSLAPVAAPTAEPIPATSEKSSATLIAPDIFLPFQTKMEHALKLVAESTIEVQAQIMANTGDSEKLNKALGRLQSIEHLVRLALQIPTLFPRLTTPEHWDLIYNLVFFTTHYISENIAWLRAIKEGIVILNHDTSPLHALGYGSHLTPAELATLQQLWNIQAADMRPMQYLAYIKRLGKPVSPLVDIFLNLHLLTKFHREWHEIPKELRSYDDTTISFEKLQFAFMEKSTALFNLMNALITKEMPAAMKALTTPVA